MAEGQEEPQSQSSDTRPQKPELKIVSSNGSPFSFTPTSETFWTKNKELRLAMIAEALEVLHTEEIKPDNIIARDYPAVFADVIIEFLAAQKLSYLQKLVLKHESFVEEHSPKTIYNLLFHDANQTALVEKAGDPVSLEEAPNNLVRLDDYRKKNQVLLEKVAKEWAARTILKKYEREDLLDEDIQAHIKHITETPGALDNAVKLTRQYISDCLARHELEVKEEACEEKAAGFLGRFTLRYSEQRDLNKLTANNNNNEIEI